MRAPVASCRRNVIKVTAVLGAQQLAASSKLIWEPVGRTVDPDYFSLHIECGSGSRRNIF